MANEAPKNVVQETQKVDWSPPRSPASSFHSRSKGPEVEEDPSHTTTSGCRGFNQTARRATSSSSTPSPREAVLDPSHSRPVKAFPLRQRAETSSRRDVNRCSKMPDELLLLFFEYAALFNNMPFLDGITIKAISQVCQRWRSIIIGLPHLWAASVDLSQNEHWVKAVISRAQEKPLVTTYPPVMKSAAMHPLSYGETFLRPTNIADILCRWDCIADFRLFQHDRRSVIHDSRVLGIKYDGRTWNRTKELDPNLPNLEELVIVATTSVPNRAEFDNVDSDIIQEIFHLRLYERDSPRTNWNLRSLDLRGCMARLYAREFWALENLCIHNLPPNVAREPAEWLRILIGMPQLRSVELINVTSRTFYLEDGEAEFLSDFFPPKFEMQHLEQFTYEGPLRHIMVIMKNCVLPTTCDLSLYCYGWSDTNARFRDFLSVIGKQFTDPEKPRLLGPSLSLASIDRTCVVRSEAVRHGPLKVPAFDLTLAWNRPKSRARELPMRILPGEVFGPVTETISSGCGSVSSLDLTINVDLVVHPSRHRGYLISTFKPFRKLEKLICNGTTTLNFLHPFFHPGCMSVLPGQPNNISKVAALLPELRRLEFDNVDFKLAKGMRKTPLDALVEFVGARRTAESLHNIGDVFFRRCNSIRLTNAPEDTCITKLERTRANVWRDGASLGFMQDSPPPRLFHNV